MEKIAITSAYQEQFGSLLVRQVRDMVMIDEDRWTNGHDHLSAAPSHWNKIRNSVAHRRL
jgi:hypothetical protein